VLRAALEKRPGDWRTAVNLGIALARTDRLAEAEALLRPFAERYPNEPIILQNRAAVLQRAGKRAEAVMLMQRADKLRRP
jgi:Flp pilus assembly protein TadD